MKILYFVFVFVIVYEPLNQKSKHLGRTLGAQKQQAQQQCIYDSDRL